MKYICIRLPISMVTRAIDMGKAEYFRGALLGRLAEGAISAGQKYKSSGRRRLAGVMSR